MPRGSRESYANAKIYKLVDPDGYYYYGSTCQLLYKRIHQHKSKSKKYKERKIYKHINEIGWDKIKIVLVADNLKVENIEQLRQIEDSYIKSGFKDDYCLNHDRSFLTIEEKKEKVIANNIKYSEHHKIWREKNKEYLQTWNKQYQEKNKEKLKEKDHQKISCVFCNCEVTNSNLARHRKTTKHITNFILY